ncbi:MAG: Rne/Rng family ribonuclease [Actinomycetota bacterium]|nr:Rne/Rng family ribonuclease [Actinomycetota bacterium]
MLDENDNPNEPSSESSSSQPTRRRAAGRPAGPPALTTDIFAAPVAPPKKAAAPQAEVAAPSSEAQVEEKPAKTAAKKTAAKKTAKKAPAKKAAADAGVEVEDKPAKKAPLKPALSTDIFAAPDPTAAPPRKKVEKPVAERTGPDNADPDTKTAQTSNRSGNDDRDRDDDFDGDDDDAPRRRRRSRGGRRRRKPEDGDESNDSGGSNSAGSNSAGSNNDDDGDTEEDENGNPTLRRRRRRRAGEDPGLSPDDPENTTVRVREARSAEDEITGVSGSTRLEAKKQRRREGREAGRRRAPIVSEAEFLARRESVKREMAIRQHSEYTQIAVLEDNVLVEHYVARESQTSLIGNVYLGKVQNVLPSMEAAFVDIGKGRNAVLYAGEVDWTTLGNGKQRKIEDALSSGQTILVQVTKDPVGQKGARLTSQISLAGRFLVYVPGGQTSGISRKLPDTERTRLKTLLKDVLPDDAGVIVRTAAEGATEDQLTRDVSALTARWEDIERKVEAGNSPELLYAEPDLMIKVVRDLFNEDFNRLVVEGDDAWDMVSGYINHVAPDLTDRLERWTSEDGKDVFTALRVEELISKALDRKVFLPSGGSLVIDRTEAMTVVDVNTGKFTGSGGNLEETVTKNNLEAAEEIVRQLRLRDIGGIIVIDFIDMVLESNRDLVLRRLVECLGRDRTRHQVAEVTSLGLVQMTRKRIGTGLLESFSTDCEHCHGRGVVVQTEPVEPKGGDDGNQRRNNRRGGGGGGGGNSGGGGGGRNNARKNDQNGNDQKSDDQKSSQPKPVETKLDEVKANGQKVEQPKPVETKLDEAKSSDQQADAPPKPEVKSTRRRSATRSAGKPDTKNSDEQKSDDRTAATPVTDPDSATSDIEVKPESSATPKSEPEAEATLDFAPEARPDADTEQAEKAEKAEKAVDVTQNSVERPVTDGPVLTGEGQAT